MPRHERQDAQTLVFFALAIVGIVALIALIVDGGFLYVQRRTAQSAADAGALAGARALREVSTTGAIYNSAYTTARANAFGTVPTVVCVALVDANGIAMATLSGSGPNCTNATTTSISGASGVHVDVSIGYNSIIAGILRVSGFTPTASATAQLGTPGSVITNDAPLIVCGGGGGFAARADSSSTPPATLTAIDDNTITSMPTYAVGNNSGWTAEQFMELSGSTWSVDQTYNGHVYYLKGPVIGQANVGSQTNACGAPSNTFDGGAAVNQTVTLPGTVEGTKGNSVASISTQVEAPGGCARGVDPSSWHAGDPGCIMFLPVAVGYAGTHSNDPVFNVPVAVAFYVWCNKSSTTQGCQEWVGELIAGMDTTGSYLTSVTISGTSAPSAPIAVHLTQ